MPEQTVSIKAVLIDRLSGPLSFVGRVFNALRSDVQELGSSLGPLGGQIATVVAAFASLQAANKAISEAEGAASAQARLLNALRGNKDELERISAIAEGLGEKFALDDDDIVDLSATLLGLGVSVNEVDKTLEAVIATSQRTGQSIDAVAVSVAKFGQDGAGRLAGIVPELKDLEESGELAAKGVDVLLDRFARSAEATDDFREAVKLTNQLNNSLGKQGEQFIKVKVAILQALLPAVEKLSQFVQSDAGKGIIDVIVKAVPYVVRLLPYVIAIAAAIAGIKIAIFVAPAALLLAKIIVIGGTITAIVAGLLKIVGLLDPILGYLGEIRDAAGQWLADIGSGKRSLEDLFDTLSARAQQAIAKIRFFLIAPILDFFVVARETFEGLVQVVLGKLIELGGKFGEAIGQPFDDIVLAIAVAIDGLTNKLADFLQGPGKVLRLGDDVAGGLRTSLAASGIKKTNLGADLVDKGKAITDAGFAQINNAPARANQTVLAALNLTNLEVLKLDRELNEKLDDRAAERAAKRGKQLYDELVEDLKRNEQILKNRIRLEREIDEVRSGKNEEARARQREQDIKDLEEQLEDEKITIERFADERRRIELEPLDEQIRKREQVIASIESQILAIREEKGANADVGAELDKLLDANRALQDATFERLQAEKDLEKFIRDFKKKRAEEDKKDAEALASNLATRIRDARTALESELARNAQRRKSGFLFDDEAVAKDEAAIAKYKADFAELRQGLAAVLDQNPEVAESFAAVRAEIEGLGEVAREANETGLADLYRGFDAGATNAITRASDLREAGIGLGESFAGAAGDIAVGFTEAEFSISNFFSSFLKQIGQALIKLAVFRALASFFGISTSVNAGALVQGANQGGPIIGLNDGGRVPGPLVNRDVVDAKLTPGEWVIQRPAVDYYGAAAMAAINSLALPRSFFANLRGLISTPPINLSRHFAGGGQVNGVGDRSTVTPAIVADEATMERLLAGGGSALRRWMRDNGDGLRGDIGAAPL